MDELLHQAPQQAQPLGQSQTPTTTTATIATTAKSSPTSTSFYPAPLSLRSHHITTNARSPTHTLAPTVRTTHHDAAPSFSLLMNTDAPSSASTPIRGLLRRLPPTVRGHTVAMLGEFVGTIAFLFFAFAGTQVANISSNTNTGNTVITTVQQKNPSQLLYISLSFGFSLAANAWVFFRISGGLFNPAVTVGMVLIGAISWVRGVLLFIIQLCGGMAAAGLVKALFHGELNVSTTLSAGTTIAQGVVIEMLLTAQLCFTIFMLAAEKHQGNFIAPVGIGISLFVSELVGVFWTGGSLNPARSFGPAVAIRQFHSTQWIYWVGPLAGSVFAVLLYKLIKALEYETANPDPELGPDAKLPPVMKAGGALGNAAPDGGLGEGVGNGGVKVAENGGVKSA
ncbi:MAG: Aquaporin-1 [Ramalina farinacea]|uniref:Aquaporin-1 n=1 Tax=Ramalina farinacea TaxID=258253 RepID=A0AA43TTD5_9LECA|nr:Aquaporin-1 [Ramalina farinacea]